MSRFFSRRSLLKFVLGAVLAILASEGVVRLAADRLIQANASGRWPTESSADQVEEMDRLVEEHGRIDVVFAGASHTRNGIDPRVVQREAGLTTYNAAMPAVWPEAQQHWLNKQVIDRLDPDVVVLGMSPIDYSERHASDLPPRFAAFAMAEASPYRSAENKLADISAIFEHRHRIKHVLTSPKRFFATSEPKPNNTDLLGFEPRDAERTFFDEEREAVRDAFVSYQVDSVDVAAMRVVLEQLSAADIQVVMVLMPLPTSWHALMGADGVDVTSFDRIAQEFADEFDVKLIDYRDLVPDDLFSDYSHLKPGGAELLSSTIAKDILNLDRG